ncbi:unnamed protein product [Darwinula stevensoni]|uniref:START domain-containing protein n=1 Tax=Darwinula stevensoni TaxID=69355 RepID=A0A7R9AFY0_9CRUS|nr:unnamed protein product [Darwinula stevensoni]CAG0903726.1 unnamed protein product [Darwinula stevensoni]
MEPKLGGILASRDFVYVSLGRKIEDSYFVCMCSTEWPEKEPKQDMVRVEVEEGSGLSFSPDPEHKTTRTLLRWVISMDMKIPLVPTLFLHQLHVEGCRQYVLCMRKYLSMRQELLLPAS